MNITILGQGAMGARMADRLEAAGRSVTRWNRTGAAQSVAQAVKAADVIIAMVRDDGASEAVWLGAEGALQAMKPTAVAIESSTLSVAWVAQLASHMSAADRAFVDAPVLGSRPQAEAGQLIHLIGGAPESVARAQPVLALLGGLQLHAGPVGAGAALKLVANTLFGVQVALVAELIGRMPALGLTAAAAIDLLSQTPVLSPTAKGAAALMLAGQHDPMFPIDLMAKDFGYAIADQAARMPVSAATHSVYQRAQAERLGGANLTAVATLY
jgi:3-hydroxyisobutyrate dehydrogenase